MTPLDFFLEIVKIPRCSKHEEKIREYLISFAKSRSLEYKVDRVGNLVIYKGKGNNPVVLQAHMDMVCEKEFDVDHDFSKDPIKTTMLNGVIKAEGTTLGADNGVGIALILSILDNNIELPPIEALFTVDEETGLTGASNLDPSLISGRMLINLDSEDFGTITIGCAGGANSRIVVGCKFDKVSGVGYELVVKGLKGGHSGVNIHEQRGNAIKILARVLYQLSPTIKIWSIVGGDKLNSIPRSCKAQFIVEDNQDVEKLLRDSFMDIKNELSSVDPDLTITIKKVVIEKALSNYDSKRVIDLLVALPNGVLRMSDEIEGLVETSTNLAKINSDNGFVIELSSRSSVESELDYVLQRIESISRLAGAKVRHYGRYPGWKPDISSPLLSISCSVFEKVFGRSPKIEAIHAGLETGIIGQKFDGIDMISIGPTIKYPHTPDEYVVIDTINDTYKYLVELLKEIKDLNR